MIFFEALLEFAVSPLAFALWLSIVSGFAALASLYLASNVAQLPVHEVLAYE